MENETLARVIFIMAGGVLVVLYALAIRWVIVKLMNIQRRDKRRMKDWNRNFNYLERRYEDLKESFDYLEKENNYTKTVMAQWSKLSSDFYHDEIEYSKNYPKGTYIPSPEFWHKVVNLIKYFNHDDPKKENTNSVPGQ